MPPTCVCFDKCHTSKEKRCDWPLSRSRPSVKTSNMADYEEGDSDEYNESSDEASRPSLSGGDHPADPSYRHKKLNKSGSIIESQDYELNYAKILVLYTGGTIGMRSHSGGEVE